MAAQRIAVAKLGGRSASLVARRLEVWAGTRQFVDPAEWGAEQYPAPVRAAVDGFAARLRAESTAPPVVHFVEWADPWSMGDLFPRWLAPPGGPPILRANGDRFEVFGYSLPDGGRLARHLARPGRGLGPEARAFVVRLREAVAARPEAGAEGLLVVLREVVGGLVTDAELADALATVPPWLAED